MRNFCLYILFILFLTISSAAQSAVYVVNSTTDSTGNNCVTSSTCSLREAIIAANASVGTFDVILVPAGTHVIDLASSGTDTEADGDLDIKDDLMIIGTGADQTIIEADTGLGDRVFEVDGTCAASTIQVTFRGLTIQGGNTTAEGGGIWIRLADVILDQVQVQDNVAATYGGGVKINTGSIEVNRSAIVDNEAARGGGLVSNSDFTIVNSTIANNEATVRGGGIIVLGGTGDISYSDIIDNQVTGTTATITGAGILTMVQDINLKATIVVDNTNTTGVDTCGSSATGSSYDFISDGYTVFEDQNGCTIDYSTAAPGGSSPWDFIADINATSYNPPALALNGGTTSNSSHSNTQLPYDCAEPNTLCTDLDGNGLYVDQRGAYRDPDLDCDIGATEYCSSTVSGVDTRYIAVNADRDSRVAPYSGGHSIYLPDLFGSGSGNVIMEFENGAFFDVTENGSSPATVSFTGTATVTSSTGHSAFTGTTWEVDVEFEETTGTPKLELTSGYQPTDITDDWRYFNMTSGTITGNDPVFGGVVTLTQKCCPFQIGVSASGKNMNFGGSGWFDWSHVPYGITTPVTSSSLGVHGDFNVDLIETTCPTGSGSSTSGSTTSGSTTSGSTTSGSTTSGSTTSGSTTSGTTTTGSTTSGSTTSGTTTSGTTTSGSTTSGSTTSGTTTTGSTTSGSTTSGSTTSGSTTSGTTTSGTTTSGSTTSGSTTSGTTTSGSTTSGTTTSGSTTSGSTTSGSTTSGSTTSGSTTSGTTTSGSTTSGSTTSGTTTSGTTTSGSTTSGSTTSGSTTSGTTTSGSTTSGATTSGSTTSGTTTSGSTTSGSTTSGSTTSGTTTSGSTTSGSTTSGSTVSGSSTAGSSTSGDNLTPDAQENPEQTDELNPLQSNNPNVNTQLQIQGSGNRFGSCQLNANQTAPEAMGMMIAFLGLLIPLGLRRKVS